MVWGLGAKQATMLSAHLPLRHDRSRTSDVRAWTLVVVFKKSLQGCTAARGYGVTREVTIPRSHSFLAVGGVVEFTIPNTSDVVGSPLRNPRDTRDDCLRYQGTGGPAC